MDANLLLRILGDPDSAVRAVRTVARQVTGLDGESAEVDVDVETAGASSKLKLFAAELARIDGQDVEVDVNVDRDGSARGALAALGRLAMNAWNAVGNMLGSAIASTSSMMPGFSGSVGTSGASMSIAGKAAVVAAGAIGGILVAAIGAAVVALAALVSSLALAVAGLGALAIAFGATLLPAVGLAIAAIKRFKDEADKAGTPANALKTAAERIGRVFTSVLGPAADRVFSGLARGLNSLAPMLRSLGPAFTQFGRIVGGALQALLQEFASPEWRAFFQGLITAASQALPQMISIFVSLGRILRNIATGAMPFLVDGLRQIAGSLRDLSTASVLSLGSGIGVLVSHLRDWLRLIGSLSGLMLGFFRAAAPAGQELVRWITEGVDAIREWVNSAEGQERIKQFFEDTIPLVKEIVAILGKVGLIFLQAFQAVAPALQFVLSALQPILDVTLFLLEKFNSIPASIRSWLVPLGGPLQLLGQIATALFGLTSSLGPVKTAFGNVFGAIGTAAGFLRDHLVNVVSGIVTSWSNRLAALVGVVRTVFTTARSVAGAVIATMVSTVSSGAARVVTVVGNVLGPVVAVVKAIFNGAVAGAQAAFSRVIGAASGIAADAVDVIGGFLDAFIAIGKALITGLAAGIAEGASAAIDAATNVAEGALNAAKNTLKIGSPSREFIALGKAISQGLAIGVTARADQALAAVNHLVAGTLAVDPGVKLTPALAGSSTVNNHHWHALSPVAPESQESFLEQAAQRVRSLG